MTPHFGRHAHLHPSVDGKKPLADKLAVDDDCSGCHAGPAALLTRAMTAVAVGASTPVSSSRPSLHGSAPARAPDRPQWARLA